LSGGISIPPLVLSGMETQPIPVCIGGDSSPASDHGSPLKRTQPQTESVSTDLHVLSRGFIPGEINGNVGSGNICRAGFHPGIWVVGYRNPAYAGLHRRGLKSRLRPWKSAQADSDRVGFNRLVCLEQGIYPRRNQWKCRNGNPTYSGLHWRGLKSRLRPWKSAQADSASDRVGLNRLACLEQGIYPRRNQRKCRV